jgi:hypothetical protein
MKLVKIIKTWRKRRRLARECSKLNIVEEIKLAEEGMSFERWPEY